jgi:hypothetical protein
MDCVLAGAEWRRGAPLNSIVSSIVAHRRTIKPWIELGLVFLSASYAAMAGYAVSRGNAVPERTEFVWTFVFSVLVTWWSYVDGTEGTARGKWELSALLMFFFWPVVLLYHLVRSRAVEGVMLYLGFIAVYLAPYLVQLSVWAYGTQSS